MAVDKADRLNLNPLDLDRPDLCAECHAAVVGLPAACPWLSLQVTPPWVADPGASCRRPCLNPALPSSVSRTARRAFLPYRQDGAGHFSAVLPSPACNILLRAYRAMPRAFELQSSHARTGQANDFELLGAGRAGRSAGHVSALPNMRPSTRAHGPRHVDTS